MADVVGLKVTLDGKEVIQESKKASQALDKNFTSATKKAVSGVRKLNSAIFSLKGAIAVAGIGFATKKVADFGESLLKSASDAEETANKYNVVFSGIEKDANAATEAIRKGFGLSNEESQRLVSNTADILTGFGFTKKAALEMSAATQRLAGDLGSFNNLPTADASERITKALTGETESLKALGIVIRQDTKEYKDLIKAIQQVEGVSLLQAKAMANIQIATEQSGNAIGDFSRSIGSFANQSRIAKSRLEDIKVELGTALLPVANQVLQGTIIPAMKDLSDVIIENKDEIRNFVEQGVNGLKSLEAPATALVKILGFAVEGYSDIAQLIEYQNRQKAQQDEVTKAYENTNKSVQDYAVIVTNLQKKIKEVEESDPYNSAQLAELNRRLEINVGLLNKAQAERFKANQAQNEATKEVEKNTEATKENNAQKTYSVVQTQELTKANNDYLDSLTREIEQTQFLRQISEQFYTESLEGRSLAIAQLELETAELKSQAAIKIEDEEILQTTLTEIQNRENDRRTDIRKKYDKLDEQLAKQELLRNSQKNAMIANMAIGALEDIFGENQVFASAGAIVDTYAAANKALASAPPPYNFALAGLVTAAGLANVAKINGVGFGVGFADGTEFVQGSGGPRTDDVNTNLSVGERVFTTNQNNQLNGLSNDDIVNIVQNGGNSPGIISDLFSREEIAQRLVDYIGLSEQIGLTVTA